MIRGPRSMDRGLRASKICSGPCALRHWSTMPCVLRPCAPDLRICAHMHKASALRPAHLRTHAQVRGPAPCAPRPCALRASALRPARPGPGPWARSLRGASAWCMPLVIGPSLIAVRSWGRALARRGPLFLFVAPAHDLYSDAGRADVGDGLKEPAFFAEGQEELLPVG